MAKEHGEQKPKEMSLQSIKTSKINLSLSDINEQKCISELIEASEFAQNYGLCITDEIAKELSVARKDALKNNGRVEINHDAVIRLVKAFSSSYFITQENLSETMGELIELFYYIKNETFNELSDDDVISEMLTVFNETCFGVTELMQTKGIEKILRKHKFGDTEIWDDYEDKELKIGYDEQWWRE